MNRRAVLRSIAAVGAVPAAGLARAQGWPGRPIRFIDAYPPGGSTDTIARLVAPQLQTALGQPILVENKPGAGGNIGAQACATAAADGHTFLLASNAMLTTNPHLFASGRVDPFKDLSFVAPVADIGIALVVKGDSPWNSLRELIDAAKRAPGSVTYGSPGVGTPMHLIGEVLKERAGASMTHVPYKGGAPMVADVVSGQVSVGIVAYAVVAGFVEQGRLRVLAVGGSRRLAAIPQVASVAEVVPGADLSAWCAIVAPPGTPSDIRDRMAQEFGSALRRPEAAAKLRPLGLDPVDGNAETLATMVRSEFARVGDLVKRLDIRLS